MYVDFTPLEKATCRLALETYGKLLEKHRKDADRLNIGTMAVQIAQGRVGHLNARFRREHDETRTVEFTPELRVCLNDALKVELEELEKLEDKLELRLVDRDDIERQKGRVKHILGHVNDQYAMEMETPIPTSKERRGEIASADQRKILSENDRRASTDLTEH